MTRESTSGPERTEVVIRPRLQRIEAVVAGAGALLFAALAVAGVPVAGIPLALVLAVAAWRDWVMCVRCDQHGVEVVSFWGTEAAGWEEITDISIDRHNWAPLALGVELRDGRVLTTGAATITGRHPERKRPALEELVAPLLELSKSKLYDSTAPASGSSRSELSRVQSEAPH